MAKHIKKLFDDNFMTGSGRRLQIRGFPAIWTEKLNYDEIGWFLFDLLVKYGPIDNISISLSKSATLYGIVDMMRAKDVQAFFDNFLDEKGHYRLGEWDFTLQFKLIGARIEQKTTTKVTKKDDSFRRYARDELIALKRNATRNIKLDPEFYAICRKNNFRQLKDDRQSWRPGPLKPWNEKSEE